MKILAVGDSYFTADMFERGLNGLAGEHELTFLQLADGPAFTPASESERSIREFAGDPAEITAALDGHDAVIVHGAAITDAVLDSPGLRLVGCARGGPVNVDIGAASVRGIPVVTSPGKNAESVADQTLAFMVMLARRFPVAQRFLLEGNSVGASAFEGAEFFGHDLTGHTVGLVGFGNVGRRVATRAQAFGMDVLVHDPFLEAGGPGIATAETLADLLAGSDFVSVHARATPENRHLFDAAAFAAMRPGSYFINTARESLVDEAALAEALGSGQLAGAALDVVDPRTEPGPHPLLAYPNVVLTPHIGGATYETLMRGAGMIAADLERFAAGEEMVNVANRSALR